MDLGTVSPEVDNPDRLSQLVDDLGHEFLHGIGVYLGYAVSEGYLADEIIERGCLSTNAVDLFLATCLGLSSQTEQLFGELVPVVLVLLDQRLQLLTEPLVEGRVFLEVDLAVLADSVLHLAGLGLGRCVLLDLVDELVREQLDWRNLGDRSPG